MKYQSPIEIISQDITSKIEDDVIQVVQSYGVFVNKQELIKALKFDRDQYDMGYADGRYDRNYEGVKPYKSGKRWHCGRCSVAIGRFWKFCQYCGQKIGWKEVTDDCLRMRGNDGDKMQCSQNGR